MHSAVLLSRSHERHSRVRDCPPSTRHGFERHLQNEGRNVPLSGRRSSRVQLSRTLPDVQRARRGLRQTSSSSRVAEGCGTGHSVDCTSATANTCGEAWTRGIGNVQRKWCSFSKGCLLGDTHRVLRAEIELIYVFFVEAGATDTVGKVR